MDHRVQQIQEVRKTIKCGNAGTYLRIFSRIRQFSAAESIATMETLFKGNNQGSISAVFAALSKHHLAYFYYYEDSVPSWSTHRLVDYMYIDCYTHLCNLMTTKVNFLAYVAAGSSQ
ncbi:hypothetical protein BaRGS_00015089 [Batillaria attramentaria]|uniref:Uncharacterized protein n=1 Tax=Batillaria attramentaria TaxID=370345 RepID=A0ABD0KHA0_9CAEN